MNIADRLRATAARVRLGWCQHALDDGDGGVCAFGALRVAFGLPADIWITSTEWVAHDDAIQQQMDLAAQFISRALGADHDVSVIVGWNNAPERTAEEVADAIEFAALLAEQEQAQSALSSDTRQLQEA